MLTYLNQDRIRPIVIRWRRQSREKITPDGPPRRPIDYGRDADGRWVIILMPHRRGDPASNRDHIRKSRILIAVTIVPRGAVP